MSAGYPLEGLRVLDMSRVLAGPYVGRMLSDLGADVVKVEPPEGDVTRLWGKTVGGLSGYYTQQNAGKRNLSADLRQPGAPQLLRRLALQADVLLENFRPGVMAQFGLSYADLAPEHPRLVMLSISGYGQRGPDADRAAYASVVHAETGIMHRQAATLGCAPTDLPVSIADMNAGLHGLSGVLAALYQRERTGRGQHIDLAMVDAMLATDDHVHLALDGEAQLKTFSASEVWEVGFGQIIIAGDFRWIFRQLNERCGLVDPTPKDATLPVKIEHRRRAVREFLKALRDPAELRETFARAGLAFGEVRSTSSALESETIKARGSVAEVDDRAGGTRRVIRSPYRFSDAQSGVRGPAPRRGEHNRAVLQGWLGCDQDEIDALHASGVLLQEPPADA